MLVKIFNRGIGAGKGSVQYCISATFHEYDPVTRKKTGEVVHRDPLPVVVKGDPERTTTLIDSSQNRWKYTSGVVAFADTDQPTEAEQLAVIESFEKSFYAGLDPDQFDVLWTRHAHEGNVELHFVMPRLELTTGKALNVAPPGYETMMSAWRDTWNYSKGWASPDEPDRAQLTKQNDYVLKIDKNLVSVGLPKSGDPKRMIGEYLTGCIESGTVKNRADVIAALKDADLEITRQGKDYISVRSEPGAKPIRLKGVLYDERFEINYDRADAILSQLRVGGEPGRQAESEISRASWRNPDADRIRIAEASAKLERFVTARARFNEQRYRRSGAADPEHNARHGQRREAGLVADSAAVNDADGSNQHSTRFEEITDRANVGPVSANARASERAGEKISIEGDGFGAAIARENDAIINDAAERITRSHQHTDEATRMVDETASVDSGSRLPVNLRRNLGLDAVPHEPGGSVRSGSGATPDENTADYQHADTAVLSDTSGESELHPGEVAKPWYERLKVKFKDIYDRTRNTLVGRFHQALDAIQRGYDAISSTEHGLAIAGVGLVESRRYFDEAATAASESERSLGTVIAKIDDGIERRINMIRASRTDELDDFKARINLVQYAESVGYEIDTRESSKASTVMRSATDKIIVATAPDGHGIYFSVRDDADNGSIIDFVQKRQGLNLGQVRKELRQWLDGSPSTYVPKASAQQRIKPVATTRDRQKVFMVWSKMTPGDGEHLYLTVARKIDTATQKDPRFIGMCRTDSRGNAVFPHYDESGLTGYELKNAGFTGFAAGGEKALWHSANIEEAKALVITESAIDAMSYAEIKKDNGSAFLSLGGQPSPKQWALLTDRMKTMTQIVIATDNDAAGESIAAQIKLFAPPGAQVVRDAPIGKDWNDDLTVSKGAPPSAQSIHGTGAAIHPGIDMTQQPYSYKL